MRRRLVLLSLATTLLVVVAFVVPLGLLVKRQAGDAARVGAESDAQATASLVALALAFGDDPAAITGSIGELPEGTVVLLDGVVIAGQPLDEQGSLASQATADRATRSSPVPGGWEIALPVVGAETIAIVDSFVTNAQMSEGVAAAWLLLGLLALVIVVVAVWVADRIGRGLTVPVEELAASAHRLAEGELETRVVPQEPAEIREMGRAFNFLAARLGQLLADERETAADLSHRLRTPLTALRLQAGALEARGEREELVAQVDRLEHAIDQVIRLARSDAARSRGECDLAQVVADRARFWQVLADEQDRTLVVDIAERALKVDLGPDSVAEIVDTIVGNIFAHTPPGTAFEIRVGSSGGSPWLEVADRGPGFSDRSPRRGQSGGGSTGLGLDIVSKTANSVGGRVEIDDRPGGGAVIRVFLG